MFKETLLRRFGTVAFPLAILLTAPGASGETEATSDPLAAPEVDLERWQDARYGLFIHWGPISLLGAEISWSRGSAFPFVVPVEDYDRLYECFYPAHFDADEWVALAREAGMKYLVFTTKHHDGFSMFDSQLTDYKITNSPFGRDVVKELAVACHRAGMGLGFYYSPPDWHHPDCSANRRRYNEYMRGQLRELCTNYGKVDVLWFDMAHGDDWDGEKLVKMIRELQPGIIINDRLGGVKGDYSTHEQGIGGFEVARPWETCMTIQQSQWAYKPGDEVKSSDDVVRALARVAGAGGNLLFNLGPMPTGEFEPRQAAVIREVGRWLARCGESIYGTRGGPLQPNPWVATTHKDHTLYVHILKWVRDEVTLPPLGTPVEKASLLTTGTLQIAENANGVALRVSAEALNEPDTVIALQLKGLAADVPSASIPIRSLTEDAATTASGYFRNQEGYLPSNAIDGLLSTCWHPSEGAVDAWLEVDLGVEKTFARACLCESGGRIEAFRLEAFRDGEWRVFHEGGKIGTDLMADFEPVTARRVRVHVLQSKGSGMIAEFHLFPQPESRCGKPTPA